MSRTLAIGDIHGCLDSLLTLLDQVKPEEGDTVVMLGDYIDRGPKSKGVIELLLNWPFAAELILLKGNHEMIMEEATLSSLHFDHWLNVGGVETLNSYLPEPVMFTKTHFDFIRNGLPYYETETTIYVHGGVKPKEPLEEQDVDDLAWRRMPDAKKHISSKLVICGHTIQNSGKPKDVGHTICIDTGACRDGWLTCIEAETRHYWQANEEGKTREGILKRTQKKKKKKKKTAKKSS